MENLLISSNLEQINFLWTVLQPVLHRDIYYSAQIDYPNFKFKALDADNLVNNFLFNLFNFYIFD